MSDPLTTGAMIFATVVAFAGTFLIVFAVYVMVRSIRGKDW